MTIDNARDEKWSEWKPWKALPNSVKPSAIPGGSAYEVVLADGEIVNAGGPYCGDVSFCDDGSSQGRQVVAYRYKIKEGINWPESVMHPDLEWLARNVSEWNADKWKIAAVDKTWPDGECKRYVRWPQMVNPDGGFTYGEWQAARQKLGLDQPDVTPEEEEAWQAKERANAVQDPEADNVNKPKHYQLRDGYEVYDLRQDLAAKAANGGATYDQYSDWDRAIEYIIRMWGKNRLEDAKKGRWYLDKLIGKLEAEE